MNTIAFFNFKGGVGKTTGTTNIGAYNVLQGKYTVIFDMDAQDNVAVALNLPKKQPGLDRVLLGEKTIQEVLLPVEKCPGLYVVPSGGDNLNDFISGWVWQNDKQPIERLLAAVKQTEDFFTAKGVELDMIIFDCPPAAYIAGMAWLALLCTEWVMVPVQADILSLSGLPSVRHIIDQALEHNPKLKIMGAYLTDFEQKEGQKTFRDALVQGVAAFGGRAMMFDTVIKHNQKVKDAMNSGVPVVQYDPSATGAKGFKTLWEEIRKRLGDK